MLTITEAAGARLAEILDQRDAPDEIAVRLVYDGQNLAMQADSSRPGDETFEHEGRTVLVLDSELSRLLAEQTLDAEGESLLLKQSGETE